MCREAYLMLIRRPKIWLKLHQPRHQSQLLTKGLSTKKDPGTGKVEKFYLTCFSCLECLFDELFCFCCGWCCFSTRSTLSSFILVHTLDLPFDKAETHTLLDSFIGSVRRRRSITVRSGGQSTQYCFNTTLAFFYDREFRKEVPRKFPRMRSGTPLYVKVTAALPDYSWMMKVHNCYIQQTLKTPHHQKWVVLRNR